MAVSEAGIVESLEQALKEVDTSDLGRHVVRRVGHEIGFS